MSFSHVLDSFINAFYCVAYSSSYFFREFYMDSSGLDVVSLAKELQI